MNYALIFAGGTGQRMSSKTCPKQFLELYGKPIIVYTLEQFQQHPGIEGIVVACLESWIPVLESLVARYGLSKVTRIVPGGSTGQESIYRGLLALESMDLSNPMVLIHDGVRPLVDGETITSCIQCVDEHGSAITVAPAIETIVTQDEGKVQSIVDRKDACYAKAPQCFMLEDILDAHRECIQCGLDNFVDSASLMQHCGFQLYTVEGSPANIKITTPADFYMFRALIDERESSQVFGVS